MKVVPIPGKSNDSNDLSGNESCSRCGTDTGVPKSLHVDARHFRVDGGGDLCAKCWSKVYPPSLPRSLGEDIYP